MVVGEEDVLLLFANEPSSINGTHKNSEDFTFPKVSDDIETFRHFPSSSESNGGSDTEKDLVVTIIDKELHKHDQNRSAETETKKENEGGVDSSAALKLDHFKE